MEIAQMIGDQGAPLGLVEHAAFDDADPLDIAMPEQESIRFDARFGADKVE
jgi:hypothetical protein